MAEKIVVIGDVMLDVYHFCRNRENPESSGPCYTIEQTKEGPGGAGNVAANLVKLGSICEIVSVVGDDENAERLEKILKEIGANPRFIRDSNRQTIVKERYISLGDGRYHFRADFEKKEYIGRRHVEEITDRIRRGAIILVSDYAKGVVSCELVQALKDRAEGRLIVDTKPVHKKFFAGADTIKPNIREVREMAQEQDEIVAAERLMAELGSNVLLTRGKEGISYFGLDGARYHESASVPKEKISDVTGAGDTVIATFCHFLSKGYTVKDCVKLANKAGGIAVQYPGCYQVSEKEILEER